MYRYNKTNYKFKTFLETLILFSFISIASITTYKMFFNKDVNAQNYTAEKTNFEISNPQTEEKNVQNVIDNAMNTVVGISKIKNSDTSIFSKESITKLGLGTGVIVSENGYILTNEHVCGGTYSSCFVTLKNGDIFKGTVVWSEKDLDLAIVKINLKNLTPITLGNSDSIKIADKVYAIGNPIGIEFERTVTAGIISGKNRTIKLEENDKTEYMEDLIQTDATINPGNSGGPLINENGEMIGLNSVKITTADGIGFAIPINIVKPVIEKFSANGEFKTPELGIFAYDKALIPYLKNDQIKFDNGIYIAEVNMLGPAEKAGLKVGDIIIKIDDIYINNMSELRRFIYSKNVGDTIKISAMRGSNLLEFDATLAQK